MVMTLPAATTERRSAVPAVTVGGVPDAGDIVYLGAEASPQFRHEPIRLHLTEPAQLSTLDTGQPVDRATWLQLTGWQLCPRGRRLNQRTVVAHRPGITVIHRPD